MEEEGHGGTLGRLGRVWLGSMGHGRGWGIKKADLLISE